MKTMKKVISTVLLVCMLVTLFAVTAFADDPTPSPDASAATTGDTNPTVKIEGFSGTTIDISKGGYKQVEAKVTNDNGYPVTWTTSDSSSVTVNSSNNGKYATINGVKPTTAPVAVTATLTIPQGGGMYKIASDTIYVNVVYTQPDPFSVRADNDTIAPINGETVLRVYNGNDSDKYVWKVTGLDDMTIIKWDESGKVATLKSGRKEGVVTVTATSKSDSSMSASCYVYVNSTKALNSYEGFTDVQLTPGSVSWSRGDGDLCFTVNPVNTYGVYSAYLDNQLLNNLGTGSYTYWNGVVTLKSSFLAKQSNGSHVLKLNMHMGKKDDNTLYPLYAYIDISGNGAMAANGNANSVYGDNAHVKGTANNLYFTATNPVSGVVISNQYIDPANYSIDSTGKNVTLSANFLNQLSYGTYTMQLKDASGNAQTTNFRIVTANYAPATGDDNNALLWLVVMGVAGVGIIALIPKKRSQGLVK